MLAHRATAVVLRHREQGAGALRSVLAQRIVRARCRSTFVRRGQHSGERHKGPRHADPCSSLARNGSASPERDRAVPAAAQPPIDDVVVEEGTFRGRHDGVARTGRSVSVDFVRVVRVRDGKHVSLHLMFDRLLMLEQLGLV
jgi:hypothetical protein